MNNPIPVTLLTGFLGSGKTTLLNALLRNPAMADSGVLVNELGEIGIDHELILGGSDDTLLLDGGCLCCQPRGSVGEALVRLADMAAPRRVLIETSGAANPLPVLESLALTPALRNRFRFARVVAVVDAVLGAEALARHEEARVQIACADHLVVTKTDMLPEAQDDPALARSLRGINPGATRHTGTSGKVPEALLAALARPDAQSRPARFRPLPADDTVHAHAYETVALSFDGDLDGEDVQQWLDELLENYGAHLLRLKGLLNLAGQEHQATLQCVRDVVHPVTFAQAPAHGRPNHLVAIARDIHPELLRDALRTLAGRARSTAVYGSGDGEAG